MKYAILDACFPIARQNAVGMAATYLRWILDKLGAEIVSLGEADVILVSIVDPRQENYISNVRKKYSAAKIYVGGAGALSPYASGLHSDGVCVGNGEGFINTLVTQGCGAVELLPEVWINGESRKVEVAKGFCWDCPPIQAEDGAFRVWCGRGCKKKCYFCQTGWGLKYEENPDTERLLRQITDLKKAGNKIAYLSNDPSQHSFYHRIPKIDHGSYSLEYLKKRGLPNARQVRLGIEGVSERLRKSVNKPLSHNDLVKSAVWLNNNKKSVRWFLIAGLPGETAADWDELRAAITDWKMLCKTGVLALSFTAWQPEPASPLAILAIDDLYQERFEAFSEWFFAGRGWSNRVNIMKPAQPEARLKSSMARMGLTEKELREGGQWGPNDRVEYPFRVAAHKIGEKIFTDAFPGIEIKRLP